MGVDARPSTRRYLKGDQTREQILHAAKGLFMERGYYNTSIYDLFEKAGITKGAFYHHWKTKEELALAILDELKAAYKAHVFPLQDSNGRARDVIEQTFRTIRELNSKPDWVYCRLMATWSAELRGDDDPLGKGVQEVRREWLEFWEKLLQRAQDQGDLRKDITAKDLAILLSGTLLGACIADKNGGNQDGHNVLETLRKVIFA